MIGRFAFALTVLAAPAAFAAGSLPVPKDTSFLDAQGHHVQQLTVVVNAPVAKVWAAFATNEGLRGWVAPVAHVDMRNDGMIEASYSMTAHIGDADNIRNAIVVAVPERLLVIRNVHAPKNAPFDAGLLANLRTAIEMENLGGGRTRITESATGYGDGPGYEGLFVHFRSGNLEEFASLAKAVTAGPVDWQAELAQAQAAIHASANR